MKGLKFLACRGIQISKIFARCGKIIVPEAAVHQCYGDFPKCSFVFTNLFQEMCVAQIVDPLDLISEDPEMLQNIKVITESNITSKTP